MDKKWMSPKMRFPAMLCSPQENRSMFGSRLWLMSCDKTVHSDTLLVNAWQWKDDILIRKLTLKNSVSTTRPQSRREKHFTLNQIMDATPSVRWSRNRYIAKDKGSQMDCLLVFTLLSGKRKHSALWLRNINHPSLVLSDENHGFRRPRESPDFVEDHDGLFEVLGLSDKL
jgi:hypothetical protein